MKKLTLNVEALAVEQFSTETVAQKEAGTVQGHEASKEGSGCNIFTCYC